MKKHCLTKVLAILLLLLVIVSYFVEGREGISYIPLADVIINYFQSFYYFFDIIVFLLVVGGFYGVLENTESYQKLMKKISNKLENKKVALFIIIGIVALFSSLTGLNLLLIIFIPLIIGIIIAMGYDKIVALLSTIGASVAGLIGGIFVSFRDPSSYYGTSFVTFESFVGLEDKFANIFPRIVLLILSTGLLILFVNSYLKKGKKVEKVKEKKEESIVVAEEKNVVSTKKTIEKETKANNTKNVANAKSKPVSKNTNKKQDEKATNKKNTTNQKKTTANKNKANTKKGKSNNLSAAKSVDKLTIKAPKIKKEAKVWPLIVVLSLLLILIVLGYMPWTNLFNISVFETFHTWLTGLKIGDYSIYSNLISANIGSLGNWASMGTFTVGSLVLLVFVVIIKFVCRVKFNDVIDNFAEGSKRMLPAVGVSMLAYTVLVCAYNNGLVETIITNASESYEDNLMIHSLIAILGSVTHVDLYYVAAGVFSPIVTALSESANLQVFALAFQSLYFLVQLIGPTSLMLIILLSYENLSYKDWLKNIWKFVLELFILIFAVIFIVTLL